MVRKIGIALLIILILGTALYVTAASRFKVHIVHVPQNIEFTNEYKPDAYMCFPAAYTNTDGKILGEYRIDGKTYGNKNFKERVPLLRGCKPVPDRAQQRQKPCELAAVPGLCVGNVPTAKGRALHWVGQGGCHLHLSPTYRQG